MRNFIAKDAPSGWLATVFCDLRPYLHFSSTNYRQLFICIYLGLAEIGILFHVDHLCIVHQLGLISYEKAWKLQNVLAGEIALGKRRPTLLLLEHPHTFTFGRRGQAENLLWDEAELKRRKVSLHWVDRGGDVTYHGPGQLVGYPLLPLGAIGLQVTGGSVRLPQTDYVGYIRRLEQTLIAALAQLGVVGFPLEGMTGVWVNQTPANPSAKSDNEPAPAKIAAIGVKVDARGVSRHGFALNVQPDMAYWDGIIGCGLIGYSVNSLADLLQPVPAMDAVSDALVSAFGKVYSYEMSFEPLDEGFNFV